MTLAPRQDALQREALRQQMLLRALWRDARPAVVGGWLRDGARFERGLQAYRANAGALAARALAAAFPTVAQLVGDESFPLLARAFWHAAAPERGDIAQWGGALPAFIDADAQLAEVPYLGDVARLDWAVHQAEQADDGSVEAQGLSLLAALDPSQLRLQLQPGTALLASPHPVVTLWQAHRADAEVGADDAFAAARAAWREGRAETALVRRRGWQADVCSVDAPTARFTAALLQASPAALSLSAALEQAGDGFAFDAWLIDALRAGALSAVLPLQP